MASARAGFRSTLPYGAAMRHAKLSRRGCWLPLIGLCLGLAATGALGQSCKYDSIPAIDLEIFPGTPAAVFWSSTPDGENADYAWYLYFSDGHGAKSHKYRAGHVRLVRGGP